MVEVAEESCKVGSSNLAQHMPRSARPDVLHSPSLARGLTCQPVRQVCGPQDPLAAKELRPQSLRARFGVSCRAQNALHCTDLEEDAPLEVGFCFDLS